MTAEIGVMNRLGVALAADSAVTIGGDARKVYSSADKLFQLPSQAPVGVMVYGSAGFLERPWETIVKAARKNLGPTTYPTLDGYADFFVDFLTTGDPVFPAAIEQRTIDNMVEMLLWDIRNELERELDKRAEASDGLTEADVARIADDVVTRRHTLITTRPFLRGFSEADLLQATQVSAGTEKTIARLFDRLPMPSDLREKLRECAAHMLIRHYVGPFLSGVVIAGFGENEYEPRIISYEMEERCLGRPRISERKTHELSMGGSLVVPFAQRDAVAAFLEGVEPNLQQEMQASVEVLFSGALDSLLSKIGARDSALESEIRVSLQPGLADMLKRLFAGWRLMRQQLWGPVLSMVAALPKDELGAVAEALVNLTKFRRRVTPVSESVGGPIDVALITKGDGFVWIKRKHYFPADLNPRAVGRLTNSTVT